MLDPVVDYLDDDLLKALPFLDLKLGRPSRVLNELPDPALQKLYKQVRRQPSVLGLKRRFLDSEKLKKHFVIVSKERKFRLKYRQLLLLCQFSKVGLNLGNLLLLFHD